MDQEDKIQTLFNFLSETDIRLQLSEECNELTQACLKVIRFYSNHNKPKEHDLFKLLENEVEEIADVLLIIRVMEVAEMIDIEEIEKIAEHKLERWINRLYGDWSE